MGEASSYVSPISFVSIYLFTKGFFNPNGTVRFRMDFLFFYTHKSAKNEFFLIVVLIVILD